MPIRTLLLATVLLLPCSPLLASSFDNEAGSYVLTALPEASREAERMDRMELCDQQPAGIYARKGQAFNIAVDGLPDGSSLDAMVGFRPMWNHQLDQQEVPLDEGENEFVAEQDGPLFFRFTTPGRGRASAEVAVSVEGGSPLPLYVDGEMDADDWAEELAAHAQAPFVQLLGDQAMITLPARVYARQPIEDPAASFEVINEVIDLQNRLAGFDGKAARDRPTPLRLHYLVDFRASKKDREQFYMYATDQFIGMLPDNTGELTDPESLRREWGIWHETGHTHQQNSWTWEALGEINVNLFSLYVQEQFGQPNTLLTTEDDEPSRLEKARDYLAEGNHDFLAEPEADDEVFVRLVMFYQLKEAYGWELFQDLHKYFRAHRLDAEASDQDKADAFVQAICKLTDADLREFFAEWGLQASAEADATIDAAGYGPPEQDFSQFLE